MKKIIGFKCCSCGVVQSRFLALISGPGVQVRFCSWRCVAGWVLGVRRG